MQVHHKPTKILIVGKSGSGKSTYQIRYVENAPYARVFLFDHKLEFEERLGVAACDSTDALVEQIKKGERFLSYHHSSDFPGDSENGFQFFCEWVYEITKVLRDDGQKSLFACDEVNRFTGTSDMGWAFRQLIEDGRLQGLDFCGTSHAANQIHNRLRLQLTEIVALRTLDPRPLAFLEENGFDPEQVKNLPVGAFITKDLDNDTFVTGKLFSCAQKEKVVKAENVEEPTTTTTTTTKEPENAISHSPAD
jgi:hypothetical protein